MRKILFISILAFLIVTITVIIVFGNYISYSFSPDDYGNQYNQKWISDDGRITFITNNKKGLFSADCNCYDGDYKSTNKKYKVDVQFCGNCNIVLYENGESTTISVALGDYYYNCVTKVLMLKVTLVDFYDSVYKVGDTITFHRIE